MKQESPNKNIIPIRKDATCKYMKKITLDKVLDSLTQKKYRVTVDDRIGQKARISIDRMLKAPNFLFSHHLFSKEKSTAFTEWVNEPTEMISGCERAYSRTIL